MSDVMTEAVAIQLRNLAETFSVNPYKLYDNREENPNGKRVSRKVEEMRRENEKQNKAKVLKTEMERVVAMREQSKTVSFELLRRTVLGMTQPESRMEAASELLRNAIVTFKTETKSDEKKKYLDAALDLYLAIEKMADEFGRKPNKKVMKMARTVFRNYKVDPFRVQLEDGTIMLPPQNDYVSGVVRLDPWQNDVLKILYQGGSMVITAPTSAGKTWLSLAMVMKTVKDSKGMVLIVQPTSPVVLQVAAYVRKMLDGGEVGIVLDEWACFDKPYHVVVGTPHALETWLYSNPQKFDFAIFDEIHCMQDMEGDSLERLIYYVQCPFMALSATLSHETAERLTTYWTERCNRPIELYEHNERYIQLSRYQWDGKNLVELHPLGSLTSQDDFATLAIGQTPRQLWHMSQVMRKKKVLPSSLDPYTFFNPQTASPASSSEEDDSDDEEEQKMRTGHITMTEVRQWEVGLQKALTDVAPDRFDKVVGAFATQFAEDANFGLDDGLWKLCRVLRNEKLLPAVAFIRETGNCAQAFVRLVETLESAEREKYPEWEATLQRRHEMRENYLARREKLAASKIGVGAGARFPTKESLNAALQALEDSERDKQNQGEGQVDPVDLWAPHPEFVMSSILVTDDMFRQIRIDFSKSIGERIGYENILMRGIRRGVGVFTRDMPIPYQRKIQELATQGLLNVVFSDESLAYGVHMPFRTAILVTDPEDERPWTALLAQQMEGRAGRRGLDKVGHVVYAGIPTKSLMQRSYGDITGASSDRFYTDLMGIAPESMITNWLNGHLASPDSDGLAYMTRSTEWYQPLSLDDNMKNLLWKIRCCGKRTRLFSHFLNNIDKNRIGNTEIKYHTAIFMALLWFYQGDFQPDSSSTGATNVALPQDIYTELNAFGVLSTTAVWNERMGLAFLQGTYGTSSSFTRTTKTRWNMDILQVIKMIRAILEYDSDFPVLQEIATRCQEIVNKNTILKSFH